MFSGVLHDKNSSRELRTFFREQFDKDVVMSEVNPIGIKQDKQDAYDKIFRGVNSGLQPQDLIDDINDNSRILKSVCTPLLANFIHRYSGFVFNSFQQLLSVKEPARYAHTGTCNPFEKKIYLTTQGKVMACERIPQLFALGEVDDEGVHINFGDVADRYNNYYQKMMKKCAHCLNRQNCTKCIFTLNLEAENPKCENFVNKDKHQRKLGHSLSLIEENPRFYTRIMRDYQAN